MDQCQLHIDQIKREKESDQRKPKDEHRSVLLQKLIPVFHKQQRGDYCIPATPNMATGIPYTSA